MKFRLSLSLLLLALFATDPEVNSPAFPAGFSYLKFCFHFLL